jgi:hypothetical protein
MRIRRNGEILAAAVEGETVLLDPTDWTYVYLNETASRIWEVIDEPRAVEAVVEKLLEDYEVDRTTCQEEVASFVREMVGRGVLIADAAA